MGNLVKFDPFALHRQFFGDDMFSDTFQKMNLPTTDVYTNNDRELIVEAHMPNFEQGDIDIHVDNGNLIIRAEKREKEEDKSKKYVIRETSSSFYRSVRLPKHANQDKIEAEMHDGVLHVKVPFKELPKPKKIAISSRSSAKKK